MRRQRQSAAPFAESERQAAEIVAMHRMLLASRGTFSLSVGICNSPPLRDYLIQRLRAGFPDIAVVSVPPETTGVFEFVRRPTGESTPSAVFVTDLERSLPSSAQQHPVLERLNGTRELWKEAYRCPIVFWLPEYAVRLLSTQARDLWAWRSHQFEFVSELAEPVAAVSEQFAGDLLAAANLDLDQKQFRVAELRERIAAAGDRPPQELVVHTLLWLNELGFLLASLGTLDQAEQTFRKALEIKEKLGRLEGIATTYGNLGIVLRTRGDLDGAEAMHRKALEIDKKLGRLEGMASDYGNLGILLGTRGDLDGAEAMHRKALEIDEKLGRLEGMGKHYGNLGNVLYTRGDLDGAEAMHRKSLEIETKLGHLEGMADDYGNLGNVLLTRGDLAGAEAMHRKALEIDEKLGRLEGVAKHYGNLGIVLATRADLDGAEAMHRKALEIDKKLGRLEGMANQYVNLGVVLETRADLDGAEQMFRRALEIDEKLGRLEGMATAYENLGIVYHKRADLARAREYWTKARDLYAKIGMQHMVKQVQGWLDGLEGE